MAPIRCPTCAHEFDPGQSAAFLPFCSERCQQIDLGRWLGERYSVSVERQPDAELDVEWREEDS